MSDNRTEIRKRIEAIAPSHLIGSQQVEATIAEQENAEAMAAVYGPPPPCPQWCADRPGHTWDSISGRELFRYHSASAGRFSINAQETMLDGAVTLGRPLIFVSDDEAGDLDAASARQFAAALLDAADRLDEINGVER